MNLSAFRRSALFTALAGVTLALAVPTTAQTKGIFLVNDTTGNPRSGEVLRWRMDNSGFFQNETLYNYKVGDVGAYGVCVGTGDFNGDGWTDALWHLGGEDMAVIFQVDGIVIGDEYVSRELGPLQYPIAVGDFNGDEVPDILLRDYQCRVMVWIMGGENGTEFQSEIVLGKTTKNGFDRYMGFADVNSDGMADVILQRTRRALVYWKSTGADVERSMDGRPDENVLTSVSKKIGRYSQLDVIGAMDVNGDGFEDLVCRFLDLDSLKFSVWVMYDDGSDTYPLVWQTRWRAAHFKTPMGVGKF